MPANVQCASASLKKAMRVPTTSEPTAPQIRLTRITASMPRRLYSKLRKESCGKYVVQWMIHPSSKRPGAVMFAPRSTTCVQVGYCNTSPGRGQARECCRDLCHLTC